MIFSFEHTSAIDSKGTIVAKWQRLHVRRGPTIRVIYLGSPAVVKDHLSLDRVNGTQIIPAAQTQAPLPRYPVAN